MTKNFDMKQKRAGLASPTYSLIQTRSGFSFQNESTQSKLWHGEPRIEMDGAWAKLKVESTTNTSRWRAGDVTMDLCIKQNHTGIVTLAIKLSAAQCVQLGRMILSLEIPRLQAGRSFMSLNSGLPAMGGVTPLQKTKTGVTSTPSNLLAVLGANGNSPCLLFGSAGQPQDHSYFKVENNRLLAGFDISRRFAGNAEYELVFSAGTCPFALLDAYGDHRKSDARPVSKTPTGWNSWDYYGGAVSMRELKNEMKAINASPLKKHLNYFTIDMGWDEEWGVWEPNRRFPNSLRAIASNIEKAGFVPGIWTAPLQVGRFTELARTRQNLFVRFSNGGLFIDEKVSPIGHALMLDFSKDEVCDLVRSWFAGMHEAGFRAFKIDYIYSYYLEQLKETDIPLGKVAFARRILQTVREGVGNDSHIVNCGAPPESAIGLADSSRISSDIHNFWGHVVANAQQISLRTWMNKKLWTIDPDFAIIRDAKNTSAEFLNMPYTKRPLKNMDDVWMAGDETTQSELLVWLSLVRLVGGSTMLSDSIARLDKSAIQLLTKLFPPLSVPARPLDLFANTPAKIWFAADPKRPTLGLFNWSEHAGQVDLPDELKLPRHAREFWTGKPVALGPSVILQPRSCLIVEY